MDAVLQMKARLVLCLTTHGDNNRVLEVLPFVNGVPTLRTILYFVKHLRPASSSNVLVLEVRTLLPLLDL